jgi:hypothetical protein
MLLRFLASIYPFTKETHVNPKGLLGIVISTGLDDADDRCIISEERKGHV